jgi:rhomboid protease GluP
MFGRKTSGSVVCPSCGSLVGVRDEKCYNCGRANPSLWGFAPALRALGTDLGFVPFIMAVTIAVFALTLIASGGFIGRGGMDFLSPNSAALLAFGESGALPIFVYGRWWTVLTATWLHAGLIHIVFNMMALRNLGGPTVDLIGPGRTVIVYVLSGVTGFLLTSVVRMYFPYIPFLSGAGETVGASASICGLIGAISSYGRRSGSGLIRAQTSQWGLSLVVMGAIMPGIDNVAHLGGFLGGYAICEFFNPLTRERGDHVLIAILCLVASLIALVVSIYTGRALIFS